LNIDDPLEPEWRRILERLTDYPADETGFMIGRNVPYAKSHRHYSHLLMVYPLCTFNVDTPGNREMIERSVLHWQSLKKALAGYSYSGSSSMFSLLGDGDRAEQRLQDFFEDKILPNAFYKEDVSSPVIETPPAAARSIEDMLIQSWGDSIRIFPAIPAKWPDVAFADLRTEGAFLVSALRKDGRTGFVAVRSLAGEPCRVRTGIRGEIKVTGIPGSDVRQLGDGLVELALPAGSQAIIADASFEGPYTITPIDPTYHAGWIWGKPGQPEP
jgi:hypothetical protein